MAKKKTVSGYGGVKRQQDIARDEKIVAARPKVTPANMSKYSDPAKKFDATFGVGAKGQGAGGKISAEQMAAAKAKVEAYKSKTGHYPTAHSGTNQSMSSPEKNASIAAANRKRQAELSTFNNKQILNATKNIK